MISYYKQKIQAKLHSHFSLKHIIQSVIPIRAEADLLSI